MINGSGEGPLFSKIDVACLFCFIFVNSGVSYEWWWNSGAGGLLGNSGN